MKLEMESDVITEDIMRIERDVFEALYNSKSCQSGFEHNRVAKKYMDAEKIWIWEFLFLIVGCFNVVLWCGRCVE